MPEDAAAERRARDPLAFGIGVRPSNWEERVRKTLAIVVSLGWTAYPIADLITTRAPAAHVALAILGFGAFLTIYLGFSLRTVEPDMRTWELWVAALAALATLLTLAERPSWGLLFIYVAVAGGLSLGARRGTHAVLLAAAAGAGLQLALGDPNDTALTFGATALGIGILMVAMGQLRTSNQQLTEAREALADRAVDEERLRFSRDLHDLLGHSLSVIALKAQLARRVMESDPALSARELTDIETVTRTALDDVRDAVQGYRQPTLATELAGARSALAAAGIAVTIDPAPAALPPSREAVLAWGVREATTNVIRHSGARTCTIRIAVEGDDARLDVTDDGGGAIGDDDAGATGSGSGLRGLTERVTDAGGRLEARSRGEGGYSLQLRVPLHPTG